MGKEIKHLKNEIKKLSKYLGSDDGLMIKRNYDHSTAIYGHGKEGKPFITLSTKGDYKISVIKLAIILLTVASTLTLIIMGLRSLAELCRPKMRKPPKHSKSKDCDGELDDYEIKF